MSKRLSEKQIAAIEYLALPGRGGLTYVEIAEKVGVDDSTIHRWRKDDAFYNAVNKAIIRNTQDRMADMYDAAIDSVITDKNAAMFRTIVQTHGMLTEKVQVDSTSSSESNVDDMRAQIEKMRRESNAHDGE